MSRNIEKLSKHFLGREPMVDTKLADNALKLCGIPGRNYVLKEDFLKALEQNTASLENIIDILEENLEEDLNNHASNSQIHLSSEQAIKIQNAIEEARAIVLAQQEANKVLKESKLYTDEKLGKLNLVDSETGEEKNLAEVLETEPQKLINSEYFFRFKNMIDNSSFEVFDGNTMIPLGWDNGVIASDASMFGTYSLKLTTGQTAKQTERYQADVTWAKGAYDTNDLVLAFYHKYDAVTIKIYDVENEEYLLLTVLGSDLKELGVEEAPTYAYEENWNRYRCMIKFTPKTTTKKIRIEFTCGAGVKGACYIDAPSLEPYVEGEFPSIYKDGRFSVSAHQLINPPPADVDRFTALEHLNIGNSISDDKGNLTHQELLRTDGTLAIKREASNPDDNGNYQTIVETFYRKDGLTVNYTDTYTYSYSPTGAILSRTKTTTEVR